MSRRLARARNALPVTEERVYLNTGGLGPVSRPFSVTLRRTVQEDLRLGRMRDERFEAMARATERIRREVAAVASADPEEIALTSGTSASLAAVIDEFPWQAGDEVICTQLEHAACTVPLREGARRGRFSVNLAQVPEHGADDLHWLEKRVTPRTRLIAFPGVSYTTGQLLPIAGIAAFARQRGIYTLLDGAQCIGAMALDLAGSGIDACAFPLQKWLCGPEGLGALYVRRGSADSLRRDRLKQSAGMLEAAAAHLEWMREALGWPWILERTQRLAGRAREAFGRSANLRLITPDQHAGLLTIELVGGDRERVAAKLRRRRIVVRGWPDLGRYRVSTAFFNTEEEISRAARAFAR